MANRSPNYPAISLPNAIDKIKLLYKHEGRHPADKEVIAKAIGYGSWNGGSSVVVSALVKYGLLEHFGSTNQLRLSEDALDILLQETREPTRSSAIRKTAFLPTLFGELHDKYGDAVPSDNNLQSYLVKKGFNPRAVNGVIGSYRGTIEFVKEETKGSVNESLEEPQPEVSMQTHTTKQTTSNSNVGIAWQSERLNPFEGEPDELILGFKIAEDCDVRVIFKGPVTQEALKKFIAHLELSMDVFPTREKLERELLNGES